MESIHLRRGFTLIELLVVLSIIGILSAITVTSQGTFNKTLILSNAAYDVALTIRQAQTYGMGSRVQSGYKANAGYGVQFRQDTPGSFTFYADISPSPAASQPPTNCHPNSDTLSPDAQAGNCYYDVGDAKVSTYTFGNRIYVSDFCALQGSSWQCANSLGGNLHQLDVVFARPNPNPFLTANMAYSTTTNPLSRACITLASPQGGSRFISVLSSGQITVATTTCP